MCILTFVLSTIFYHRKYSACLKTEYLLVSLFCFVCFDKKKYLPFYIFYLYLFIYLSNQMFTLTQLKRHKNKNNLSYLKKSHFYI